MTNAEIAQQLAHEIERLTQARNLLASGFPETPKKKKKKSMSAEARAKISRAMKRRWKKAS